MILWQILEKNWPHDYTAPAEWVQQNITRACTKLQEGAEVVPGLISGLCVGSAKVWIFLDLFSDNLCRCDVWDSAAWTTVYCSWYILFLTSWLPSSVLNHLGITNASALSSFSVSPSASLMFTFLHNYRKWRSSEVIWVQMSSVLGLWGNNVSREKLQIVKIDVSFRGLIILFSSSILKHI